MKQILATITVTVTLVASSASAFDPGHLKMLKDIGVCLNCDLGDANLNGADLRSADLRDTNLSGADLSSTNLNGADLSSAFLRNAKMRYARMKGVILCNTTMPDGSVIYSGC